MRRVVALVGAVLSCAWLAAARADFDPTVTHRLSAQNAHRTAALPVEPRVAWRTHLGAELCPGLAPTGRDGVLVATRDARLLELDSRGRVAWQQNLDSPAVIEPLVLPNGDRVTITEQRVFRSFSATGTSLAERRLPMASGDQWGVATAMADGSLVAATSSRAWWLENDGAVRSWADLGASIDSLLPMGDAVLLGTDLGEVFSWGGHQRPQRVNEGNGYTRIAAWTGSGTWLQATQRALSIGRLGSTPQLRWELAAGEGTFWGRPLGLPPNRAAARLTPDLLVVFSGDGERRLMLSKTVPAKGAIPPPMWSGPRGQIALFANDGRLAQVSAGGALSFVPDVECAAPSALASTAAGMLVASCSNGTLFGIEEGRDPPR